MNTMKYLKVAALLIIAVIIIKSNFFQKPNIIVENDNNKYSVHTILTNLDHPWGIDFFSNGDFIFTERINKISLFKNGKLLSLNAPADTFVNGEGGMLGIVVDPNFEKNQFVYACFNSKINNDTPNVIVARFELDQQNLELKNRVDIISDIPANPSGRHSGCQLEFGPDGFIWIATGDTATQSVPQDPKSLGGKILKVDSEGNPAPDNLGGDFDPRIFSYGHRNSQGLSFFKNDDYKNLVGISIEHGPDRDDEVNLLTKGNFGWDPLPYYGEAVPMTDKDKFGDAVDALWESGYPTIAASGGTIINSDKWGAWQNSIAVAALKGSHILIINIDETGKLVNEEAILNNEYGRFRIIKEDYQGNLYLLTDNGRGDDTILRLEPK